MSVSPGADRRRKSNSQPDRIPLGFGKFHEAVSQLTRQDQRPRRRVGYSPTSPLGVVCGIRRPRMRAGLRAYRGRCRRSASARAPPGPRCAAAPARVTIAPQLEQVGERPARKDRRQPGRAAVEGGGDQHRVTSPGREQPPEVVRGHRDLVAEQQQQGLAARRRACARPRAWCWRGLPPSRGSARPMPPTAAAPARSRGRWRRARRSPSWPAMHEAAATAWCSTGRAAEPHQLLRAAEARRRPRRQDGGVQARWTHLVHGAASLPAARARRYSLARSVAG